MSVEEDQIGCEDGTVLCGCRFSSCPLGIFLFTLRQSLAWNVPWGVPAS